MDTPQKVQLQMLAAKMHMQDPKRLVLELRHLLECTSESEGFETISFLHGIPSILMFLRQDVPNSSNKRTSRLPNTTTVPFTMLSFLLCFLVLEVVGILNTTVSSNQDILSLSLCLWVHSSTPPRSHPHHTPTYDAKTPQKKKTPGTLRWAFGPEVLENLAQLKKTESEPKMPRFSLQADIIPRNLEILVAQHCDPPLSRYRV